MEVVEEINKSDEDVWKKREPKCTRETKNLENGVMLRQDEDTVNSDGISTCILQTEDPADSAEALPNNDFPLLVPKKKDKSSKELYKKNFCSVLAGVTLVFYSVIVLCLALVILTNPETFGPTKGANHNRIALNKYYSESFPNYWLISRREQADIYYHQVEPGSNTWRCVNKVEQWIWAEGASVTIHTVNEDRNHSMTTVGDALLLHGDLFLSFSAQSGTWISLEIPVHTSEYTYSLLHVISSPDFYHNSTTYDRTRLHNLYPEYTSVTSNVV